MTVTNFRMKLAAADRIYTIQALWYLKSTKPGMQVQVQVVQDILLRSLVPGRLPSFIYVDFRLQGDIGQIKLDKYWTMSGRIVS